MAFIPFDKVVKVDWVYSFENSEMVNSFYWKFTEPINESILAAVIDNANTWWDENLRLEQVSALSLIKMRATDLTSQNAQSVEVGISPPVQGANTGQALPANVAYQVSWTTGFRGRSFRGRSFWPGFPEDDSSGSTWATAVHTRTAVYAYNLRIVDFEPYTATPVVCSREYNGVPRTVGVATPITGHTIYTYVASQRRRLPGRGR